MAARNPIPYMPGWRMSRTAKRNARAWRKGGMVTACQVCEAPTNNTYLCRDHTKILRRTLDRIPWWLSVLEDTTVGNVRMGAGGRKATRSSELHGDTPTVRPLPGCRCDSDECTCELGQARQKRQHTTLNWALSTGKVNGRASRLAERINNELGATVRDLCEKRGTTPPSLNPNEAARYLSHNITAIAADQSALEIFDTVIGWEAKIRRLVNRRPKPVPVGACPDCGTMLETRDTTVATVECAQCDTTWDAAEVREWNSANLRQMSFTVTELLDLVLPARGIHVHRRYVQIRVRNLNPTGYTGNTPRYLYGDVEQAFC